ncbi:glycoside hydrolase family 3 protein [Leptospira sp. GIMC2001]|uniref:glycoside hydrolase family 3 protein n=1 Tax=Leptospira sp. GIMC2001 TaxID=1513297 RepID=UPI00234B3BBF|nr:glycoside hydrolase family 3 protein [Leptospira sp. GIMC2001]WCL48520.1 glycoside hydrolase family 3 protein [Leptospira sp. GIMC2001]
MKTLAKAFLLILFILFIIVSTHFLMLYLDELRADERKTYLDIKAREIVQSMSTREKIGQIIHITIPEKTLDSTARKEILSLRPGGIILFGKNLGSSEEVTALNQSLQNLAKSEKMPPLLISTDQEGGRVFRARDGVAQYPGAMAVGQTNNAELGYEVGFVTSYDLNQIGINFLLAPSLDINNNPNNPVINTRSFGSDIDRVNLVAGAYERGARKGGAIPVIKHFPGHGDTDVDSHLGLPVIRKTLAELEELELIPFQNSIHSGAPVVMTAHILFPNIDDKYPATLSKKILTDILRERLGFDGVIITDAMEMHAISKNYDKDRPGVKALLAGVDILLLTSWGDTATSLFNSILDADSKGEFTVDGKDRLEEAVYRQIRLKLEYGIYTDNHFTPEIENENLANFMLEQKKKRDDDYNLIKKDKDHVFNLTKKTIRSYPNPYQADPNLTVSNTKAFLTIGKNQSNWKQRQGKILPMKSLSSELKKSESKFILLDAVSESELKVIDTLASNYPDKQFIVLFPASPFVVLPKRDNVNILFSFSLTDESYKALIECIFSQEMIPKMDLVLK